MQTISMSQKLLLLLVLALALLPLRVQADEPDVGGTTAEQSAVSEAISDEPEGGGTTAEQSAVSEAVSDARVPARHVLLVYDSLAVGTKLFGNVATLQRLLSAAGAQVTMQSEDGYYAGQLRDYPAIVQIRNQADLPASAALTADLAAYAGRYLHIGAELPEQTVKSLKLDENDVRFSQNAGKLAYVPSFGTSAEDERAMAAVLAAWLGLTDKPAMYLLIKEVYPFSDLPLLLSLSDRLYDAGIPFMLAVRPVFTNLQQPAMKRYIEAIRYAQSKGGSIVVQAPVVASTIASGDGQLRPKMSAFIDALAAAGIAPLGVVSELYWSYDSVYAGEGLALFDSAVLLPDEKRQHRAQTNISLPFASSLFALEGLDEPAGLSSSASVASDTNAESFQLPAAQIADMPDSAEELDRLIERLAASWQQFADYRFKAHTVQTSAFTIESESGVMRINGKAIGLDMEAPEVNEESGAVKDEEKSTLSLENNILIAVIVVSLVIFGYFIYLGYGMYKRKYYK
jgi:hypothetical protein